MTQQTGTTSAHLEVVPATSEQAPILANLIELYAHDFSDFLPIDVGEDGKFGYPALPLYWSDPDRHPLDRHPFLIRIDGKLAGFALIQKGSEVYENRAVWDMAEFFILRRYRRHGAGTKAVRHRPDRILVGEVRGAEARTLLDAMNTGHRGTLATIHASGAEEAIHRLATLAMRSSGGLSLTAVVKEVERCLDHVVFISRRDGIRAVEKLLEVERVGSR
jgi:GNAT superfamily N-acetyltransferase